MNNTIKILKNINKFINKKNYKKEEDLLKKVLKIRNIIF